MNKNIKKIISTIIITISLFTMVGCGQIKGEIKEEVTSNVEVKTEKTTSEVKVEEVKSITKEELAKFETLINKYPEDMAKVLAFTMPKDQEGYITLEEAERIKVEQTDVIKAEIVKTTPDEIKEMVNTYLNQYEEYFVLYSEGKQGDKTLALAKDMKSSSINIETKIKEIKTQLDNK